ncbi:MAG: CocE/NonD family hydrolase C-terminal non-catalytic domain-containing protein [candidate division WOR-3 bacterium]
MPGHRIMVIISSANYPRFEANPNNGGPFVRDDTFKLVATNKIYHSPNYPSYIKIPMYPTTAVKEMVNTPVIFKPEIKGKRVCFGGEYEIFSISGKRIFKGKGCSQDLKRGVYIAKRGKSTRALVVK